MQLFIIYVTFKAIAVLPLRVLGVYFQVFADPALLYHIIKQIRKAIFQQSLNLDK